MEAALCWEAIFRLTSFEALLLFLNFVSLRKILGRPSGVVPFDLLPLDEALSREDRLVRTFVVFSSSSAIVLVKDEPKCGTFQTCLSTMKRSHLS